MNHVSTAYRRLRELIESFKIALYRPDEIMEQVRSAYRGQITEYSCQGYIEQGLLPWEKRVIMKYASRGGSFLILGSGGGRESIALAKIGYQVTGIDALEEMNISAGKNAKQEGVEVDLRTGDIMDLSFLNKRFDYCALLCFMYSTIPSSRLRIQVLSNIADVLNERGIVIVHFFSGGERRERLFAARKFVARVANGFLEYASGDQLSATHYWHIFSKDEEIKSEARAAGFSVREFGSTFDTGKYAVLEKV